MTKKLLIMFVLIVMTSSAAYALELWNDDTVGVVIDPKWGLSFNHQVKFNDNFVDRYEHIDATAGYKIEDWMILSGSYRGVFQNAARTPMTWISQPRLNLKLLADLGSGYYLSNEFRAVVDMSTSFFYYWNVLNISYPIKTAIGVITPFVSPQPYIGINSRGFYQMRTDAGFTLKFAGAQWFTPGLFYVYELRNIDKSMQGYNCIDLLLSFNF